MAYASARATGKPWFGSAAGAPDEPDEFLPGITMAVTPRYPMMSSTAHTTMRKVQTSHRPPDPRQGFPVCRSADSASSGAPGADPAVAVWPFGSALRSRVALRAIAPPPAPAAKQQE